jgi:protein CWC15
MLLLKQTADVDEEKIKQKYDDEDLDDEGGGGGRWSDIDDNNNLESDASDLDASDDDLDSDDEDEEAALQAELTKIRAERAATKAKEEAETAAEERAQMEEAALTGNPLLNSDGASGRVKRRWNDDVVFRNQAKGEPDQNKKRFINDTVRNDFHKRFLNKFIK